MLLHLRDGDVAEERQASRHPSGVRRLVSTRLAPSLKIVKGVHLLAGNLLVVPTTALCHERKQLIALGKAG